MADVNDNNTVVNDMDVNDAVVNGVGDGPDATAGAVDGRAIDGHAVDGDAIDARHIVDDERDTAFSDVIFDYCDVLLDWRPRLALERQAPDDVLDWFFDARTPYGFWHYDALSDAGVSERAIVADFARHHADGVGTVPTGGASAAERLFSTYFDRQNFALHGMIPGMAELLKDLDAAGVRLWGLTNFTAKFVHAAHDRFPAFGLLRDTLVSSEERIRKPDPAIYRLAVRRFGVNPAASAFVDDKDRNARASRTAGLNGIRFVDATQARAALLGE